MLIHDTEFPDIYVDLQGKTWYLCATTQRYYHPDIPTRVDGPVVWIDCTLCDTMGHVNRRDPNYNPFEPQPHAYWRGER
jgi:hypothetical protein